MVAVVSGSGLGLFSSTGNSSNPQIGRGNDRVFINSTTGNLLIQSQDDTLAALGLDLAVVRTYNSRGLQNDDNGDNWRLGAHQRLTGIPGTPHALNSTITKTFGDGAEIVYRYDQALGRYVSTDGDGAHDSLSYSSGTWTWTDGSGRNTEAYNASGQLSASRDADGNTVTYGYDPTSGNLTSITDASGQVTTFTYTGPNLTSISTTSGGGQPATLVRYYYDGQNRLRQVVVDLTPATAGVPLPDVNGDGLYETTTNETYITTYTYDGTSKRVQSITQSDGSSISFGYTQIADGTWRVSSYSESGQGVVTLPVVGSALVSSQTTNVDTTYNLVNGVVTPPGWGPVEEFDFQGTRSLNPVVQYDAAGNGFAMWVNGPTSGPTNGTFARRFSATTGTWGATFQVSTRTFQTFELDEQGNGLWVGSDASGIWARRFDGASGTWGTEQLVAASSVYGGMERITASIKGNQAVVALTTQYNAAMQLRQLSYAVAMTNGSWGALTLIDQTGIPWHAQEIKAQVDSQGNASVLVASYPSNASPLTWYLHANRFTASTGTWSGPTQIDVLQSPTGNGNNQIQISGLRMEFDDNGNGFALYERGTWNSANPQQIAVMRYTGATNTWGPMAVLASYPAGGDYLASGDLRVDAQGNAMAVWAYGSGYAGYDAFSRYFNASAGTWGATTTVDTNSSGDALAQENGRFALLFSRQITGGYEYYTRRFENGAWSAMQGAINISGFTGIYSNAMALQPNGDVTLLYSAVVDQGSIDSSIYIAQSSSVSRYTIPNGATWNSVALALYGNEAVIPRLQQLYSSVTAGTVWKNLPTSITVTTQVTTPVNPPYYLIVNGDTWATIAQKVYNSSDAGVSLELARLMNNVALTPGNRLYVPSSITALVSTGATRTTNITYTNAPPPTTTANANPAVLSTTDTQTTTNNYNVVSGSLSTTDTQTVNNSHAVVSGSLSTTDTQTTTTSHSLNTGQLSTTDNQTTNYSRNDGVLSTTDTQTVNNSHSLNTGALSTTDTQTVTNNYTLSTAAFNPVGFAASKSAFDSQNGVFPQVQFAANGNGMAVWARSTSGGAAAEIYVRTYSASTLSWSDPVQIATASGLTAVAQISFDMDEQGNALVAWDNVTSSSVSNVFVRRYSVSSGWGTTASMSSPFRVATMSSSINGDKAVIGWTTNQSEFRGYAANLLSNGSWATTQVGANTTMVRTISIAVAVDAQGNATALMHAHTASSPSAFIQTTRFNPATATWAGTLTTLDSVNVGTGNPSNFSALKLQFDANGNGMASWHRGPSNSTAVAQTIVAVRFDKASASWGALQTIATQAIGSGQTLWKENLSVDAAGNAMIAWEQRPSAGGTGQIYARYYTAGAWGSVVNVATGSSGSSFAEIGITSGNGRFAIGFLQNGDTEVWAARFESGAWQAATRAGTGLLNGVGFTRVTLVALHQNGDLTALWDEWNGSTRNLFANQYAVAQRYTVPSGASWQSIANALYGVNSSAAGSALQSAMGNPALIAGAQMTGWPSTLSVTTTQTITVPPYYTIPSGATWQSIANALYGVSTSAAANALQSAMGNPALTAGNRLTGFPNPLSYQTTQTVTVPPYFTIPSGATWQSIASTIYGANSAAAGNALQSAMGNPPLTAGNRLTGLPSTLSVTVQITVPAYYAIPTGSTWQSVAGTLYGNSSSAAGSALQSVYGGQALSAFTRLTNLPSTLSVTTTQTITVPPYYTIPSGATWQSIANAVYGVGTTAAANALQTAMGNPSLVAGNRLTGFPNPLTYTVTQTVTVPPYYTIPSGATWQSIANAVYGQNTSAAANALQAALGNPALTAGNRLTGFPNPLAVTTTTTITVPPYYLVPGGATWASVTQAVYGVSDANAVAALQSALGSPALTAGAHLAVPASITYVATGTGTGTSLTTDVTDAAGRTTTYTQDAAGRLRSVLSPTTGGVRLQTSYDYDSDGNLVTITEDPAGLNRVTTMGYDSRGNLTSTRDNLGNTVTRTYDDFNQITSETRYVVPDPDGAGAGAPATPLVARYVYDGNATASENHLRFVIDADGRVTQHQYDASGQRTVTLRYLSAVYTGTAFAESDLTTWANVTANKTLLERTEYAYDFRGNLSALTTFVSNNASTGAGTGTPTVTKFLYDQRGQLLQKLEARGSSATPNASNPNLAYSTTYVYDGLGRTLATSKWDSASRVVTTLNSYDDANRVTKTTFANGLVSTSAYDKSGRLINTSQGTALSASSLGVTTYSYDVAGRLRIQTDPALVKQFFFYDEAGRKVAQVDGDGSLLEYVYNRASQLVKTIQYSTRLSAANLAALVDSSGNAVDVSMTTLRLQAGGDAATNRVARSVYDGAGRLVYSIDETGAVKQVVYDGAGRVTDNISYATRITVPRSVDQLQPSDLTSAGSAYLVVSSPDDRRSRTFYAGSGNVIGTLDAAGYIVEYTYDNAGHLKQETRFANVVTDTALRATGTFAALKAAAGTDTETSTDFERDITTNYFYDGQGRQVGVLDGERYLTETVYDVAGNISQTIVYNKVLTYSASSTLTSLRNAALAAPAAVTHTTTYQYDGFGRVTQSTNFEGTQSNTVYDSAGSVTSVTDAAGTAESRQRQTRYDELGRVVRELTGEGSAALATLLANNPSASAAQIDDVWDRFGVLYAYDQAGRRVSATTRPNDTQTNVTRYFYDDDGRIRFEINQLGERIEYRYDALNQLTDQIRYFNRISVSGLAGGSLTPALLTTLTASADGTRDARTTYTYDVAGRIYTTVSAEGASTTLTYSAFGQASASVEQIDATRSVRHEYEYDARGLLKTTRWDAASGGLNTSEGREYDAFGRLWRVTDARGNTTRTEYDRLGRQTASVTATNARSVMTYDAFSRVLTLRDVLANTTSYSYDDASRTMTVTTPEGIAIATVRTRHGQTLSVTAAGNTTTYAYDLDGNLEGSSDNLGSVESRTYDRGGRLETQTDARGVVTRLSYDAANRTLTRTEDHGAGNLQLLTVYGYDALGRIETVTEPSGRLTRTTYDRDGRVSEVAIDPSGLNLRTSYGYDRQGHTLTVTEGVGSAQPRRTQYLYDNLGRRTEEILDPTSLGGTLNLRTQYRYDANGNMTRRIDAAGNSTWYVYDTLNRLTHTVNALGNVELNSYDSEGHVTATRRYANAMSSTALATLATLDSPAASNISVSTNALDRLTRSFYDRDGREQYTIDAAGTVTERVLDAGGRVTRMRLLSSPALTGSYSNAAAVTTALGAAATTIAAEDRVQWMVYDVRGRVAFTVDGLGAVTRNTYDENDNVVASTAFATRRSTSDPTDLASLQSWAASNGANTQNRTTRFWYDRLGRQRFALDAEGYLTETRYADATREQRDVVYAAKPTVAANATLADVTSAAAAIVNGGADQVTVTTRDLAGRVQRVTDALGNYEEYTYDALGNKQTYRNKKGAIWTYVYDALGRLSDERSPNVAITTLASSGTALSSTTETASIVTRLTYDALGNLKTRTEGIRRYANGTESTAGSRTTTYNYDVTGRQTSTVNPQVNVYNGSYTDTSATTSQTSATPTSTVTYDALGNATRNVDIGGGTSYRVYDNLGRVRYEIDALRYVTEHVYDMFGNETAITRFSTALSSIPSFSGNRIALSTMNTAVSALRSATDNRTVTKTYDRANRVRSTAESSIYAFEAGATAGTGNSFTASPTTYFDYDAFGNVVREWRLVNPNGAPVTDPAVNAAANTWATTHHYYDRRGLEIATVDALRYLTRYEYDETGDITNVKEFAKALTSFDPAATAPPSGTSTSPGSGVAPDGGYDRETMYLYDALNRRTSETLLNFENAWINGLITEMRVSNKVRSLGYDALGNQTSVTENGATVYNYYDVLGRLTARAEPARNPGDGTSLIPITEIKRDIYGNSVEEVRYAAGAATVNATSYTLAASSAALERHSFIQYDALDRAIASQDARGALRTAAYNARGDLVKEWQTVTNRATTDMAATPTTSVAETLVTLYQYDVLGQRTATFELQTTGSTPVWVKSRATYNGFGEIKTKSVDGGWTAEFYEYDNAGRVWRTNSGDGIDKVYLYDLAGRTTAEIRSRTLNLADSATYANAAAVNALAGTMRTETRYDLLGRAIEQRSPQFDIQATQDLIDSQPQMAVVATPNPPNAIYRQIAVSGGSGYPGGWGGFVYVPQIVSYAEGGGWYQVQAPSASNPYGVYARYSDAQYSVAQQRQFSWQKPAYDVIATFEYWPASNPSAVSTADIYTLAPDRVGVNVNSLSGSYGYRISYKRVGATSNFATQQGTFDTATNEVVRGTSSALETQTVTPTVQQAVDRWGNVIAVRDAAGGLTQYRYNQLNQLTYTLLPSSVIVDTSFSIEQRTARSQLSNYYDVNGRLFETRDGMGNVTRLFYNAAGQQLRVQNADHAAQTTTGSEKRFVYDAFNNVLQVRDELGYRTRNVYDKADNLVQVAREIELNGFASASASDTTASNAATVLWEYYTYDETGRRIADTNGEGEVTKYWYDLRGNMIRRRTPRNFDTTFEYDAFARKTRETDANATFSTWTYDAFGRLTAHAEMVNSSSISTYFTAGGAVHAYTYDEAGLLLLETTNLGKRREMAYDAAGHLTSITDNGTAIGGGLVSVSRVATYNYDGAGRKVREKEVVDGRTHQDTRIEYDGMGRIASLDDLDYRLQYFYDANGNRTLIRARYYDHQMVSRLDESYYRYDQMNRVTISQGMKSTGAVPDVIFDARQGVMLTYDAKGQRTSARTRGTRLEVIEYRNNGVVTSTTYNEFSPTDQLGTDFYAYDGLGRLMTLSRETHGIIRDANTGEYIGGFDTPTAMSDYVYDKASRQVTAIDRKNVGPNLNSHYTYTVYDDDGRSTTQSNYNGGALESIVRFGDAGNTAATRYNGYDAASVLRGYKVEVYDSGTLKYTTSYQNAYRLGEGYQDTGQSVSSTGTNPPGPASTSRVYDVNGDLVQFNDSGDVTRTRYFANNANGQALTVIQGQFDGASGRMTVSQAWDAAVNRSTSNQPKAQYFFFVDGKNTGSFGQLQKPDGTFDANFDVNYTPVSSNYPASAPTQVIAQTGDTLRTIAARVFGDASLWYVLAEENGLSDPSAVIKEGTVIKVPNEVVSLSNTAGSFKPFDAGDAIGDTNPTQPAPPAPKPKKGGCGVIGMIIVAIVAIVVTVFTAGAAAAALVPALGSIGSAVVGGAIGAAVGSIASQGVGIAIGVQDKFNWGAVAKAAIGGAIGGALFGVTSIGNVPIEGVASTGLLNSTTGAFANGVSRFAGAFGKASGFVQGATNAVVSNVLTQGASMAFGLQKKFNWREVASSAVAGGVSSAVTDAVGDKFGSSALGTIATRTLSGFAGGVASAFVSGGKIDYRSIAADSFGNALGNAFADTFAEKPLTEAEIEQIHADAAADRQKSMDEYFAKLDAELRESLENNPPPIDLDLLGPLPTLVFEEEPLVAATGGGDGGAGGGGGGGGERLGSGEPTRGRPRTAELTDDEFMRKWADMFEPLKYYWGAKEAGNAAAIGFDDWANETREFLRAAPGATWDFLKEAPGEILDFGANELLRYMQGGAEATKTGQMVNKTVDAVSGTLDVIGESSFMENYRRTYEWVSEGPMEWLLGGPGSDWLDTSRNVGYRVGNNAVDAATIEFGGTRRVATKAATEVVEELKWPELRRAADEIPFVGPEYGPRTFNGIDVHPDLPPPAAGWDYKAPLLDSAATEAGKYAHIAGMQGEVRLANTIAARGDIVVKWGDRIGANGNDIVSINPRSSEVSLWDNKFRSNPTTGTQSPTFSNATRRANAVAEAQRSIQAATNLPPAVRVAALNNLRNMNYVTNTAASGAVRNSTVVRYVNGRAQ
jgi:YD repeat-containing protein